MEGGRQYREVRDDLRWKNERDRDKALKKRKEEKKKRWRCRGRGDEEMTGSGNECRFDEVLFLCIDLHFSFPF